MPLEIKRRNRFYKKKEFNATPVRRERKIDSVLADSVTNLLHKHDFYKGKNNFLVLSAGMQHTPSIRVAIHEKGIKEGKPVKLVEHVLFSEKQAIDHQVKQNGYNQKEAKEESALLKSMFIGIKKHLGPRLKKAVEQSTNSSHQGIVVADYHTVPYELSLPHPSELKQNGTKKVFLAFETTHADAQKLHIIIHEGLRKSRQKYLSEHTQQMLDYALECKKQGIGTEFIGFDTRHKEGIFTDLFVDENKWNAGEAERKKINNKRREAEARFKQSEAEYNKDLKQMDAMTKSLTDSVEAQEKVTEKKRIELNTKISGIQKASEKELTKLDKLLKPLGETPSEDALLNELKAEIEEETGQKINVGAKSEQNLPLGKLRKKLLREIEEEKSNSK